MLVGAVCYSWVQRRMRLLGVNVRRGAAKARMLSEIMEVRLGLLINFPPKNMACFFDIFEEKLTERYEVRSHKN